MGLSIHYSGTLKDRTLIGSLMDEIVDNCKDLDWTFQFINSDELNGIVFASKDCEPLFFTFDHAGQLINPIYREHKIEPATTVSTKTQYAGIDAHVVIIKLARHPSKKYFSEFSMMDEGGYWETDDITVLRKQFSRYEAAMDIMTKVLESLEAIPGESAKSLAERIAKLFDPENKKNIT